MTGGEEVRDFYDAFSRRVLQRDFETLNLRLEDAGALCDRFVRPGDRVLEVGCGVGILSRRLLGRAGRLLAVDLSPANVEVARRFAEDPRASFAVVDVTEDSATLAGSFDAIVLADVVEHLPRARRPAALRRLVGLLELDGRLILTYPSPAYQEWLRAHDPDVLQVVDEVVHVQDLIAETGLAPYFLEHRSPWFPDQYVHLVLARPAQLRAVQRPLHFAERLLLRARNMAWRWRTRAIRRPSAR